MPRHSLWRRRHETPTEDVAGHEETRYEPHTVPQDMSPMGRRRQSLDGRVERQEKRPSEPEEEAVKKSDDRSAHEHERGRGWQEKNDQSQNSRDD